MFHRIPVNVIAMFFKVEVVANLVFPVSRLPDGLRPFSLLGQGLWRFVAIRAMAGEIIFDGVPAYRVIFIAGRQGPNAMQMFRQQYKGVDGERMRRFHGTKSRPQKFDVIRFA